MSGPVKLFELNPRLDRNLLSRRFAVGKRVQIREFLTAAAATAVHDILSKGTPWGLAWQAGDDGPHGLRREQLLTLPPERKGEMAAKVGAAMQKRDYGFVYAQYRMLDAYLGK